MQTFCSNLSAGFVFFIRSREPQQLVWFACIPETWDWRRGATSTNLFHRTYFSAHLRTHLQHTCLRIRISLPTSALKIDMERIPFSEGVMIPIEGTLGEHSLSQIVTWCIRIHLIIFWSIVHRCVTVSCSSPILKESGFVDFLRPLALHSAMRCYTVCSADLTRSDYPVGFDIDF